jgi:hypothetical protein
MLHCHGHLTILAKFQGAYLHTIHCAWQALTESGNLCFLFFSFVSKLALVGTFKLGSEAGSSQRHLGRSGRVINNCFCFFLKIVGLLTLHACVYGVIIGFHVDTFIPSLCRATYLELPTKDVVVDLGPIKLILSRGPPPPLPMLCCSPLLL